MRHSIPSSDDMWFDLHNKFDLGIQVEILRSLFEKFFALICGLQILGTRVEITNDTLILKPFYVVGKFWKTISLGLFLDDFLQIGLV